MRFPVKIKLFSKKEKGPKKTFKANSYSHLRQQQKRSLSIPKLGLPDIKSPRFKKRYFLFPIILIFLVGTFLFISKTDVFTVQNIEYNREISSETSKYIEDRYKGRNLFSFSAFEIQEYLENNIPNVDGAFVRKVPPNSIKIEIELQNPQYIYASFTEFGVLTDKFQIIDVASLEKPVVLTAFEKDLFLGIENKNAKDIEDYYLKNITPEQREELILEKDKVNSEIKEEKNKKDLWDVVPDSEKEEILIKIKGEVFAKLDAFVESIKSSEIIEKYPETNLVYIFDPADIGASHNEIVNKLAFAGKVIEVLKNNKLEYKTAKWITNANFQILIENNKTLIFNDTVEKSIETQLKDLSTVVYNKELEKGNIFDFRTKNYSIY